MEEKELEKNQAELERPEGKEVEPAKTERAEEPPYVEVIEGLRKERDEYFDLLLRKQAEFDNFRKRVLREKEEERFAGQADLLKEILPVIDACEKGLEMMNEQAAAAGLESYREGYELLLRRLKAVLEKFGVEQVPGAGAHFDPAIHEAVLREETSEFEDGVIVEEFRKGYTWRERLLRPAQVKVAVRR